MCLFLNFMGQVALFMPCLILKLKKVELYNDVLPDDEMGVDHKINHEPKLEAKINFSTNIVSLLKKIEKNFP